MGSEWAPAVTFSIFALSVSAAFVHERLDFAERMLAKTREAERLPPVR